MRALAPNFDPLTARADEIFQRGIQVNLVPHLVKVSHGQIATAAYRAFIGLKLSQNHLEQSGFTGTVGADEPQFVAAQHRTGELTHHGFALGACAVVFADLFQFSHDLAAGISTCQIKLDAPHYIAASCSAFAQLHQSRDAALGPCAPCLDTSADPHLFLCQHFVGAGIDHSLLRELLFL